MIPLLAISALLNSGQTNADAPGDNDVPEIISASEIDWGALNPARGTRGPGAADLWGKRSGVGPAGFLVRFTEGFASPPHIHNISYRGIVIHGEIHNDDPAAARMWMSTGSWWTQPAGEVHITAARGSNNLAYVEIQRGPYLVQPTEDAHDNGERPVNVDSSNIVWLDAAATSWIKADPDSATSPQLSFLWGRPQDKQAVGTLVRLPAGFTGSIQSHNTVHRAVVIQGQLQVRVTGPVDVETLDPGSFYSSAGESEIRIDADAAEPALIYVRSHGRFVVATKQGTSED